MPVYDRSEARKGGWAQVRDALTSFEGNVISIEEGQWGGTLIDEEGNPLPPKEFFEVSCTDVVPLEVTEELSMDISEGFSFRVNMSEWEGSFWVDEFLASADGAGVLLPDGILHKRIVWRKATKDWVINGIPRSYTNYVIDSVKAGASAPKPKVVAKTAPVEEEEVAVEEEVAPSGALDDPMAVAIDLAVGKTETQFRSAISLHPTFVDSPLLPLAKAGAITQSLVEQGKLVLVKEGNKEVYKLPE